MEILFLGTGTSQGVPVIGCSCPVCHSTDKLDQRLRSSILIQEQQQNILIDIGPDFRQQALLYEISHLDAIVVSHSHRDHTAGLDEVRSFNYLQKSAIDLYAETKTLKSIRQDFSYIFDPNPYPGVPKLNLHPINKESSFFLDGLEVIPIEVRHGNTEVMAFRVKDFCYITDANFIEEMELQKILGVRVLVVNALRKEKHPSHFNLEEALSLIEKIAPERAYLTHVSHYMGFSKVVSAELPKGVNLAYDGLRINC